MMTLLREQNILNAERYIGRNEEAIPSEVEVAVHAAAPAVPEKRCYSVEELQHILGASSKTVYKLIKKKVFHSFQIGTNCKIFIEKKSFDMWLENQMLCPPGDILNK